MIVPAIYILVSTVSIVRFGDMLKDCLLTNIGQVYPYYNFHYNHTKSEFEMESMKNALG